MSNGTKREALLKVANLVRPALAAQPYIPALTHIAFDGKAATAFNDVAAIMVRCALDIERCIPGELLIRALGSFGGETVMLQEGKGGSVVVSSGRSRVTVPTLAPDAFPLEWPGKKAEEIGVSESMLLGIQCCLLAVGNDHTHPATMGVTLDADKRGRAVLYSTDNHSISSYYTDTKVALPGDSPVIMPTFFCEQLLRLHAAFPEAEVVLKLYAGALTAEFGDNDARLLTKTLVDLTPLDFAKTIERFADLSDLDDELSDIPDGFEAALDRALLVLASDADKTTRVLPADAGFKMESTGALGESVDTLKFKSSADEVFHIDPALIARASKVCQRMAFLPRVVVLNGHKDRFTHIVAHVTPKQQESEKA